MRTGTPLSAARGALVALVALVGFGLLVGGCGPREQAAPAQRSPAPLTSPAAVPEPKAVPAPTTSAAVEPPAAPVARPTSPSAAQPSPLNAAGAATPATTAQPAPGVRPATAAPATPAPEPVAVPPAPATLPSPAGPPADSPPAPGTKGVEDPGGEIGVPPTRPGLTRVGAEKCKVCHKLQYASWSETAHAKRQPPLECESCHGPGSEYKAPAVMKEIEKAKAAGLVLPTATFCTICHRQGWTDDQLWKAHAHKRPPRP